MENPYDPYGPLVPDLALAWKVQDDLRAVTFHFHELAKWSNTESFACEDARFSFETMATGEGLTRPYMQKRLANVDPDQLECYDDGSLHVVFSEPTATPLYAFVHRGALVFNKAWFLEGGEDAMFTDVSLSIGPFQWVEGQEVGVDVQRFERNPHYFRQGLPYLDELTIYGILDERTQLATHLAHQTDWHWVRHREQYQPYVDHDQILTVARPTGYHSRLWINPRNHPFDNVRVRQAVMMGIDSNVTAREIGSWAGPPNVVGGGYGYPTGSGWAVPEAERCAVPG